jgi:hypothetical protein
MHGLIIKKMLRKTCADEHYSWSNENKGKQLALLKLAYHFKGKQLLLFLIKKMGI